VHAVVREARVHGLFIDSSTPVLYKPVGQDAAARARTRAPVLTDYSRHTWHCRRYNNYSTSPSRVRATPMFGVCAHANQRTSALGARAHAPTAHDCIVFHMHAHMCAGEQCSVNMRKQSCTVLFATPTATFAGCGGGVSHHINRAAREPVPRE
jgi:hypothetical protein